MLAKRPFRLRMSKPLISFTFDDFPVSAKVFGETFLSANEIKATYYLSMGLLGKDSPVGRIVSLEDVAEMVSRGEDIGCHTYFHSDAYATRPADFENSIRENAREYSRAFDGQQFITSSYPLSEPRPQNKRIAGSICACCRGGGQTINRGTIDLNLLRAVFIDWRTNEDLGYLRALIDQVRHEGGWLIFATHDVYATPSRFGVSETFFKSVVEHALASGADVLSVSSACRAMGIM